MVRSRSFSPSPDEDDNHSSPSSGSETEDSSSSRSSSLSSSSRRPATIREKGRDALAVECMERHQRLRRLLSQRSVGDAVAIDDGKNVEPFFGRRGALDGDDCIALSTFSNAVLFSRLLTVLRSCEGAARSQNFDELLSRSNPVFYRKFKVSLEEAAAPVARASALTHHECTALDRGGIVVHRKKRSRDTAASGHSGFATNADKSGHKADNNNSHEPTGQKTSTTSGIIASSLRSWEQYLAKELKVEGVSIESFRQQRHGNSYLEDKRFLEESQWADYQRELQLEEKRKAQEAKRAIRRGENNNE